MQDSPDPQKGPGHLPEDGQCLPPFIPWALLPTRTLTAIHIVRQGETSDGDDDNLSNEEIHQTYGG